MKKILLSKWIGTCLNFKKDHVCTEEAGCGYWKKGKKMGKAIDKMFKSIGQ